MSQKQTSFNEVDVASYPRAPVWRHAFAMFYDLFLLIPLLMVTSALLVALHGPAESAAVRSVPAWQQWILAYLALIGFFGLFWRQQGQTLGMQAWRIKLISSSNATQQIGWMLAAQRISVALLPILSALLPYLYFDINNSSWIVYLGSMAVACVGFLWRLATPSAHYLHDQLSDTELVLTPKRR